MIEKFTSLLKENFSENLKEETLLIAVSGGVDSMVLSHLFHRLDYRIHLIHCNFRLRKESEETADFIKHWAEKINTPVSIKSFDTQAYAQKNQLSIQMAARQLRYEYFEKIRLKHAFHWIATAHHLDDCLETFLINLGRASGLKGLVGIPKINGAIIRPLLHFSKEEIVQYAQKNQLPWKEDTSNLQTDYLRNKMRHWVIPELKKTQKNFLNGFAKSLSHLQNSQNFIHAQTDTIRKKIMQNKDCNTLEIDLNAVKQIPNPQVSLYALLRPFGFKNWKDIENLITAQSGKQLLSHTHRLIKNRQKWLLCPIQKPTQKTYRIQENIKKITTPLPLCLEKTTQIQNPSPKAIYVDKKNLQFPLLLRKWQKGDVFYPSNMKGKKKLSQFFKDKKYSLLEKEQCFILCNGDKKIIWIVGKRSDDRFKIQPTTKEIIKIYIP